MTIGIYRINNTLNKALKNLQSRFFRGSICAQRGFYMTKEDTDNLRKKVTRPIRSKKYKKSF